jgi:hypothetical protein
MIRNLKIIIIAFATLFATSFFMASCNEAVATLTPTPQSPFTPDWSISPASVLQGRLILFRNNNIYELVMSNEAPITPTPILEDVSVIEILQETQQIIYRQPATGEGSIYSLDLKTYTTKLLFTDIYNCMSWSPDEKSVIVDYIADLYLIDSEGNIWRIYESPSASYTDAVSPGYSYEEHAKYTCPQWLDNHHAYFSYYTGSMPSEITVGSNELLPNTHGVINLTNPEKFQRVTAVGGQEINNSLEAIPTSAVLSNNNLEIPDESPILVEYDMPYQIIDICSTREWMLLDTFFEWTVAPVTTKLDELDTKIVTPCSNCEVMGFVPNTCDLFYLESLDGSAGIGYSAKLHILTTDSFEDRSVTPIGADILCDNSPNVKDSYFSWLSLLESRDQGLRAAYIENCRISDQELHSFLVIKDLSSGSASRLMELVGADYYVLASMELLAWLEDK